MLISKVVVGAAIVLGVVGAVPAGAEPGTPDSHANPFGSLGCSCQGTGLTSSRNPSVEIDRGIASGANGLAARTAPLPE